MKDEFLKLLDVMILRDIEVTILLIKMNMLLERLIEEEKMCPF